MHLFVLCAVHTVCLVLLRKYLMNVTVSDEAAVGSSTLLPAIMLHPGCNNMGLIVYQYTSADSDPEELPIYPGLSPRCLHDTHRLWGEVLLV